MEVPSERGAYRPILWIRANLFDSWLNAALTVSTLALLSRLVARGFIPLMAMDWSVIRDNLKLILTGSYPASQLWRVWAATFYVSFFGGASFSMAGARIPKALAVIIAAQCLLFAAPLAIATKACIGGCVALQLAGFLAMRRLGPGVRASVAAVSWTLFLPLSFILAYGLTGPDGWMPVVSTNYWGGLLLTLMIALTSIALSFPLGLLLALGRRSSLPLVKVLCTCFIEAVRGVPLITILFIGYLIIPLALPPALNPSVFIRAMIGVIAFHSAYMAENFRGGLQGIQIGRASCRERV